MELIKGLGIIVARFMPQNFNDLLCLLILAFLFALWFLDGLKTITLNPEVLGASIAFFTIVGQFYYRKAKGEAEGDTKK